MPTSPQKTTDELFSTNYAVRPTLKSPLQKAKSLDPSFLSNVTDEELDAYEIELENYKTSTFNPRMREQSRTMEYIVHAVNNIFGSNSKESKYFHRAVNNGTLLEKYFGDLTTIRNAKKAVDEARQNSKHTSNVSLQDKDIAQIDLAIQYLISNGFKYGEDFTSNNAVNIAKSEMQNTLTASDCYDASIVEHSIDCSDVCRSQPFEIKMYETMIVKECACGEVSQESQMSLATDHNGGITFEMTQTTDS